LKTSGTKIAAVIGAFLLALLLFGCTQNNPNANNQINNTTPLTGDQVANTAGDSTISDSTGGSDMIDNGEISTPNIDSAIVDANEAGIGEMI
jgi:hypothetical protein